ASGPWRGVDHPSSLYIHRDPLVLYTGPSVVRSAVSPSQMLGINSRSPDRWQVAVPFEVRNCTVGLAVERLQPSLTWERPRNRCWPHRSNRSLLRQGRALMILCPGAPTHQVRIPYPVVESR